MGLLLRSLRPPPLLSLMVRSSLTPLGLPMACQYCVTYAVSQKGKNVTSYLLLFLSFESFSHAFNLEENSLVKNITDDKIFSSNVYLLVCKNKIFTRQSNSGQPKLVIFKIWCTQNISDLFCLWVLFCHLWNYRRVKLSHHIFCYFSHLNHLVICSIWERILRLKTSRITKYFHQRFTCLQ